MGFYPEGSVEKLLVQKGRPFTTGRASRRARSIIGVSPGLRNDGWIAWHEVPATVPPAQLEGLRYEQETGWKPILHSPMRFPLDKRRPDGLMNKFGFPIDQSQQSLS